MRVVEEKIRSFIAFDIDDELVLNRISKAQSKLVNTGADLRLVKPQNIHVTIRFLGSISIGIINQVSEKISKQMFIPFDFEIQGLGAFPSLNYSRVIWVGIRKGTNELREIFNKIEPDLRNLGFKPDTKGFSPHLTIARVRTGRSKSELVRCIRDLTDYKFGVITADCLRLKKSVLTPKGPIYSTIHEIRATR